MKRPRTILWFEILTLASLALSVGYIALYWQHDIAPMMEAVPYGAAMALGIIVAVLAPLVVLTLLVSRRRSRVAMWVLIVVLALLYGPTLQGLFNGTAWTVADMDQATGQLEFIAQVVAIVLLFTPSARAWLKRSDENPALTDTFS